MAKKVIRITESELKRKILAISKAQIKEQMEGAMNNVIDRLKQEAAQEVDALVKRYTELHPRNDISRMSLDNIRRGVKLYDSMLKNRRDSLINQELDTFKNAKDGDYTQDQLNTLRDEWGKHFDDESPWPNILKQRP
jgi:hypothetical protein